MTSTRYSSGSGRLAFAVEGAAGAGAPDAADVLAGLALAGKAGKGGAGAPPKAPKGARPGGALRAKGARKGGAGRGGGSLLQHDFWVALRQLAPVLLVALAAFAVAMPVSTAAIPDASVFNLDYTHDQMKFRFWLDDLTYPVVLGMRAFRFLLVKCEATAVLSLPLSRTAVFGTRYAACLLALVAGIGIPLAASLVVNIAALNVWAGLFEQFAYIFAGLVLTGAVACTLACIACALAGTLAEAAAFCVAVLASVTVAAWGLNAVMDWLLVGNAAGEYLSNGTTMVAPSLVEATSAANPLLFFAQEAADHQTFVVQHPVYYPVAGDWLLAGVWALVLAALAACALWLLRRRKGEKAGIAGLNVALSFVVGIVVGLAAFGGTFTLLASLNVDAATAAAFAVFLIVSALLLRGPLKGRASGRRTLAVLGAETAALACVLAAVATGGFGFSAAVPAAEDVAEVEVSYTGSPSYLAARFDTATAGDGAYYFSASYSFDDAEAVGIVRDAHEQLIASGGAALAEDHRDFQNTVMPYDVVLRYTLSDGSELVRYYDRATLSTLAALTQLDGTQRARELARAAVSGDLSFLDDGEAQGIGASAARQAYALGDIYLSDRLYANPMLVNCDVRARAELLAALAEDVAGQSVEDRYHPEGTCRGVLMFTQSGETAAETFSYGIENAVVYLTDEFTHTLAWLEEKGLVGYTQIGGVSGDAGGAGAGVNAGIAAAEVAAVESLTFQRFAPYDGMNEVTEPQSAYFMGYRSSTDGQFVTMQDFGTKFSTDDADQIAELLPLCRNAYYLDGGGYLVAAKLTGQEAYSYLFIPMAEAPEWLIRVAG